MNITGSRRLQSILWVAAVLSAIGHPLSARAQTSPTSAGEAQDDAAPDAFQARKLFLEGRELLDRGQPQEACERFERSQQLSPTLGTLLNLGLCHRYCDRLATAHDYYRRAEVMATLAGDDERREVAHDEAAEIAPKRPSLTLRITGGSAELPLEIELDGVLQAREVWQRPIYVDAGEHRIAVRGPGREAWHGSVVVADAGKYLLVIPELRPESGAPEPAPIGGRRLPPSAAEPHALSPARAALSVDRAPPAPNHTSRIVAITLGGAGIVALGVSVAFGAVALSTSNKSNPHCSSLDHCDDRGRELRVQAHANAARANALGIAGAVALVGAAALWLLLPPPAADGGGAHAGLDAALTRGMYRAHF